MGLAEAFSDELLIPFLGHPALHQSSWIHASYGENPWSIMGQAGALLRVRRKISPYSEETSSCILVLDTVEAMKSGSASTGLDWQFRTRTNTKMLVFCISMIQKILQIFKSEKYALHADFKNIFVSFGHLGYSWFYLTGKTLSYPISLSHLTFHIDKMKDQLKDIIHMEDQGGIYYCFEHPFQIASHDVQRQLLVWQSRLVKCICASQGAH